MDKISNEQFLIGLTEGQIPLAIAEMYMREYGQSFPDNMFTAVSHYIDDSSIRNKDAVYDVWMRIFLFDQYITILRGNEFHLQDYFKTVAQESGLHCMHCAGKNSLAFYWEKRIRFRAYGLSVRFFRSMVTIVRYKCLWPFHLKFREQNVFCGSWQEMDLELIRRQANIVGAIDKMVSGVWLDG